MKININDYEVKIEVKDILLKNERYNKKETLEFLNWLSMALHAASKYEDEISCYAIAKELRNAAHELFVICKKNGLYKNQNK